MNGHTGVNETHHNKPKKKASQDTRVIKSCRRWVLCGNTVACPKKEVEIYRTTGDTHCNVRESQVHSGIQHGSCCHVLEYEITELCITRYKGCVGRQQ